MVLDGGLDADKIEDALGQKKRPAARVRNVFLLGYSGFIPPNINVLFRDLNRGTIQIVGE